MSRKSVRARLKEELRRAMRERDAVAIGAFRSAVGAIDNAEAVDGSLAPPPEADEHLAGSVLGLGAGEVARRELTEAELEDVLRAEVDERVAAAGDYERSGRHERAERLRREAEVVRRVAGASES